MKKIPLLNERLYLRSPSINVCFRIIVEGLLEKSKIEKALELVCIRHPFLNSFVDIDDDNNAWLIQKNEPLNVEYYAYGEMDWQTWYKKTDNTAFLFSVGPLVKICVIAGKNTEIIILGHHIIGDGIGYLNLVKDILLALDNRLDCTPQIPPSESSDRYFKQTVLLDDGVRSFANGLNEEWRKSRVRFSEKDYSVFFENYRNKFAPDLYMAVIEENNLQKLMEKSTLTGLSVNETIASAFSLATMETLNKNEIRLGVAANIRRELVSEPNNCMGNFVTGISAKVERASDFAGILREQLLNAKNRHLVVHFLNEFDKDLIESAMYSAYGSCEHPVSKKLAELIGEQQENKGLGISNLGRYNFTGYDNFTVMDIQFIGPAFPANLLTVGVITINGKMNLCLRYNAAEMENDTPKIICDKALGLMT